ncbi:M48 family metallopeptidase [Granulosicoccaceae sp. 1_MG-2023]|nr:M48 family metallopeptidase [Granulosicoccaceae sp. 1_MG-2023]
MKYSNRPLPEGINNPKTPFWRSFWVMLIAILLVLAAATLVLGRTGAMLAMLLSYDQEQALVARSGMAQVQASAPQRVLQRLADELAESMQMQAFMPLTIHYVDDNTVNAFATLGGHLLFHRGLVSQLGSENALAMLIAHELAHVQQRHPITSLGQGLAIESGLSLLFSGAGPDIFRDSGFYTRMKFSRDMERAADKAALQAVYRRYGHVGGALDLYTVLLRNSGAAGTRYTALMQTHPLTQERIDDLRALAQAQGWPLEGALRPLPAGLD